MLEDEYEYVEEESSKDISPEEEQRVPADRRQNVVSLQSAKKSSKVILIEPRVYAEAQEVADHLVNRKAVIVNLQRIHRDQALRIVDFLSGTVYALGGDIQRVGHDIFLCTPDNVEVSGNISELMNEHDFDDSRWN